MKKWSILLRSLPAAALVALFACSVLWRGGKGLESLWLLMAATGFFYLFAYPSQKNTKDLPLWLYVLGVLSALWAIASFTASSASNYGFAELLRELSVILVSLYVARLATCFTAAQWRAPLSVLTVVSLTAVAVGMLVYLYQPLDRFVGSFFYYRFHTDYWPNAWAEFVLLAWPLVLWQLLKTRWLGAVIVGVLVGSLFLSFSRGAILCFAAQILLAAMLLLLRGLRTGGIMKQLPQQRVALFWVPLAIVVALAVFFGANMARAKHFPVQSVTAKATFTSVEGRSSIDERSQFWRQAVELALQKPLLGWGPGSFRFVQPRLQQGVLATSDHPHNVFLKHAMERGIPAAALLLLILFVAIFGGLSAIKSATSDEEARFFLFVVLSFVGVLLHNQIDFNLQFIGIALPFSILLGILLSRWAIASSAWRLRRWIETVVAVFLLLTFVIEGRFLVLGSIGRHAHDAGRDKAALESLNLVRGSLLPRDLELTRAHILWNSGKSEEALEAVSVYVRANREDARAWELQGDIRQSEGRCDLARSSYDAALLRGKFNQLGSARGSLECSLSLNDRSTLTERRKEFVDLAMAYGDAILSNAHFIDLSPNVEEYARFAGLLARAFPSDAARIKAQAHEAVRHAFEERAWYRGRDEGGLW